MAKVHFQPYFAVKYTGSKAKEIHTSLARPKPKLKKGDILIVDKKQGFNLVEKGFGEFEYTQEISFVKADTTSAARIEELERQLESDSTAQELAEATKKIEALEKQNLELKNTVEDLDTKLKTNWMSTKVLTAIHEDPQTDKSALELIADAEEQK